MSNVAFQISLLAEAKPLGSTKASYVTNSILHLLLTVETIKSELKKGVFFSVELLSQNTDVSKCFKEATCYCTVIGEQSIVCLMIVFKTEMKIDTEIPEKAKRS